MNLLDELTANNKIKKNLTILDVDFLLYVVGHQFKDMMNIAGEIAFKDQIRKRVGDLLRICKTDFYLGFFSRSGKRNFRNRFATIKPYKGHRKKEEYVSYFEPICYDLLEELGFYNLELMEADDAVVISYFLFRDSYNITFVNVDKDLRQIGAYTQFNPKKYRFESFEHDENRAFFWGQHVEGDSADGISGIQGQGKKSKYIKALHELDPFTEEGAYEIVKEGYITKYGDNAFNVMCENYILLTMLREPILDYDPIKIKPVEYVKEKRNQVSIKDI